MPIFIPCFHLAHKPNSSFVDWYFKQLKVVFKFIIWTTILYFCKSHPTSHNPFHLCWKIWFQLHPSNSTYTGQYGSNFTYPILLILENMVPTSLIQFYLYWTIWFQPHLFNSTSTGQYGSKLIHPILLILDNIVPTSLIQIYLYWIIWFQHYSSNSTNTR